MHERLPPLRLDGDEIHGNFHPKKVTWEHTAEATSTWMGFSCESPPKRSAPYRPLRALLRHCPPHRAQPAAALFARQIDSLSEAEPSSESGRALTDRREARAVNQAKSQVVSSPTPGSGCAVLLWCEAARVQCSYVYVSETPARFGSLRVAGPTRGWTHLSWERFLVSLIRRRRVRVPVTGSSGHSDQTEKSSMFRRLVDVFRARQNHLDHSR